SMSNTFAGIRPLDVPAFVIAEFIAAAAAVFLVRWLFNNSDEKKTRVLILCTGNSARSQMAEGILRSIAGDKFDVESAGVSPSNVRPEAVKTMNEIGIDISGQRSKSVEEFTGATFDFMITVCDNAREICPILPGNAVKIHHNFEDPPAVGAASHEETMEIFRRVRDEIHDFLIKFSHGN
ncbi:MAG: arsenate reductase ArsC, partial [Pyrinomonadaceae bacterium]